MTFFRNRRASLLRFALALGIFGLTAFQVHSGGDPFNNLTEIGGVGGTVTHWLIYPDGRVITPEGATKRLDPAEIQEIVDVIRDEDFFEIELPKAPSGHVMDTICVRLTVELDGRRRSIAITDFALYTSEELQKIVETIKG